MKTLALALVLLFPVETLPQGGKPVPPGLHQAEKAEQQSERNIPPPQTSSRRNPQVLQQDADELARLAQSIPADLEQINHGVLPKDLNNKLKRIEKLSKRLRNDLAL
jgi:hypothetical protein